MFLYCYKNVVDGSIAIFKDLKKAKESLWEDFIRYSPDFSYPRIEETARTFEMGYIYDIGAISLISVED